MGQSTKRKLAAILMADVAGYSRLMGEDEEGTVRALKDYREVFFSVIDRRDGRVVNAPGDSVLAEFGSVVDAVACAVEIQGELAQRNGELPEDRRMRFRIGLHLGDVVTPEGDDAIYGDGVNVAARLESLADPGCIVISRMVHDSIQGKLALNFEYMGEHTAKNIAEPIRAYRVLAQANRTPDASASPFLPADVPDQPSIAVLPFNTFGGDPDQAWFSDGLTETIITDLSKLKNVFVIARNSSFKYKGQAVDVREIGRALGVQNILEGSIQKSGTRVRINAQLTEAATGRHVWAERYDRELDDIFELQDDITQNIVSALQVKLGDAEYTRIKARARTNLQAWEFERRAWSVWQAHQTCESLEIHKQYMERSASADSKYAPALVGLVWNALLAVLFGCSEDPGASLAEAIDLAERAFETDKLDEDASLVLALTSLFNRRYEQFISASERAIDLAPNRAGTLANVAWGMIYAMEPARSIELMSRAMRLNPHHSPWYTGIFGMAHFWSGRIEEAQRLISKAQEGIPNHIFMPIYSSFIHYELGDLGEAKRWASVARRIKSDFKIDSWLKFSEPYQDAADAERVRHMLAAAGMQ